MRIARPLEETQWKNDRKLLREVGEFGDEGVALERLCQREMLDRLVLTKIGRFEQLGQKHDSCTLARRPFHHRFGLGDVGGAIPCAGELRGSKRDGGHTAGSCWVMQ